MLFFSYALFLSSYRLRIISSLAPIAASPCVILEPYSGHSSLKAIATSTRTKRSQQQQHLVNPFALLTVRCWSYPLAHARCCRARCCFLSHCSRLAACYPCSPRHYYRTADTVTQRETRPLVITLFSRFHTKPTAFVIAYTLL